MWLHTRGGLFGKESHKDVHGIMSFLMAFLRCWINALDVKLTHENEGYEGPSLDAGTGKLLRQQT